MKVEGKAIKERSKAASFKREVFFPPEWPLRRVFFICPLAFDAEGVYHGPLWLKEAKFSRSGTTELPEQQKIKSEFLVDWEREKKRFLVCVVLDKRRLRLKVGLGKVFEKGRGLVNYEDEELDISKSKTNLYIYLNSDMDGIITSWLE